MQVNCHTGQLRTIRYHLHCSAGLAVCISLPVLFGSAAHWLFIINKSALLCLSSVIPNCGVCLQVGSTGKASEAVSCAASRFTLLLPIITLNSPQLLLRLKFSLSLLRLCIIATVSLQILFQVPFLPVQRGQGGDCQEEDQPNEGVT